MSDLRIADVRVTPVLVEDPPLLNLQGVHQPYTPRVIVEVETEDGVVGLGETYGDDEYLEPLRAVAALLPGRSVASSESLWEIVAGALDASAVTGSLTDDLQARRLFGRQNLTKLHAIVVSAFEVAFLDAMGRSLGLPVHQLLGGKVRDRVDFAGYLFYKWEKHPVAGAPVDDWGLALDPEGVVAQAQRMIDQYGFGSLKLKGGVFPPDEEIAATRALRDAFPGVPVRLDPNGAWSVDTGTRVAEALRDTVEYLEDPCTGVEAMAEVHRRTGVPLATNMCVTSMREIPEAFRANAVQVVLCDHHFWGGLRATQALARICETFGVGLSMHSNTHLGISLAAMTQAAACAPGHLHACDTHRPWQTDDVITEPHVFRDGALTVSDAPGLGVELDRAALARYHERWRTSDVRSRDDVAAMRVVDPGWNAPSIPRW
ncbi:enolase C-terminal domain-like protein [Actinoallomurus sp. NPDC050550]|uniref:enolase C-terminal domain-like protein n=1 Tax=Actinoallomurus sp. NPDC050550 TaxID=3154937 RepID=UPI0033F9D216